MRHQLKVFSAILVLLAAALLCLGEHLFNRVEEAKEEVLLLAGTVKREPAMNRTVGYVNQLPFSKNYHGLIDPLVAESRRFQVAVESLQLTISNATITQLGKQTVTARLRGSYPGLKQFLGVYLAESEARVLKTLHIAQPGLSGADVQMDVTFIDLHRPLDGAFATGQK